MEIIRLKYIKNYRDLGGIQTTDGRTLKNHMLIRGTTLTKLHEKDIELLKTKYNLKTIIDLRTKKEIEEKPDVVVEGVKYIHLPLLNEATVGISHEKKVRSLKSLEMMPPMEELYISMVSGGSQDNLVNVLKQILLLPEDAFSLAFHCTAGKDRTGIIAALILAFLGVDRKNIMIDYLFTNKSTKFKPIFVYIGLLLVKFKARLANKIRIYHIARPVFIESALSYLEQEYGSLENFFEEKLEFTPEQTAEIKNKFLN